MGGKKKRACRQEFRRSRSSSRHRSSWSCQPARSSSRCQVQQLLAGAAAGAGTAAGTGAAATTGAAAAAGAAASERSSSCRQEQEQQPSAEAAAFSRSSDQQQEQQPSAGAAVVGRSSRGRSCGGGGRHYNISGCGCCYSPKNESGSCGEEGRREGANPCHEKRL